MLPCYARVGRSVLTFRTSVVASSEGDMYRPFVDASAAALDALRNLKIEGMRDPAAEVDMRFHISDAAVDHQNHHAGGEEPVRKPGVIILPSMKKFEVAKDFHREDGEWNKAAEDYNDAKLPEWKDMIGVVEFKRRLGKCIDASPDKYDVLPYKPIKPEFSTNSDESDTNVDDPMVGLLDGPPSDRTGTSEQGPCK